MPTPPKLQLIHDPAAAHAAYIYRTRANRRFCSIVRNCLSWPPLGRPQKVDEATAKQVKQDQQQCHDESTARMAIESKFGQGARRFGLARLMATLVVTFEVKSQVSFLVMNVEHLHACVGSFVSVAWWQGWLFRRKDRLVAKGNTMNMDFSDRSACGIEI